MKVSNLVTRFNGFSLWPKIIIGVAALLLVVGVGVRASGALKYIIFGNTEAKREHGNVVVAQEQTKAEGNIADQHNSDGARARRLSRAHHPGRARRTGENSCGRQRSANGPRD
jgi:hypothetical protein